MDGSGLILAIDAGNSRTKWGVFDQANSIRAHGNILNTHLQSEPTPALWSECERIVISNVAGEMVARQLRLLLGSLKPTQHWIQASEFAAGVKNHYAQASQLGVDRWAAIVAAWQLTGSPCVVVNAGTALTIDALAADDDATGIFLGGVIVPGLRLLQQSLFQGTAGIAEFPGGWQDFPQNTGDAVHTGALSAMAGAVMGAIDRLAKQQNVTPRCIITGGDALVLADVLGRQLERRQILIEEHLVLQGLCILERDAS